MKTTVIEVVRRVETALERATREQSHLPWQVDYAELLLWVRAQPNGAAGPVITRRPGGVVAETRDARSVLSLLPWPFRGSKLVRDYLASRSLCTAIEAVLHTVNTLARDGCGYGLTAAEVRLDLIVESSGDLRILYEIGAAHSSVTHKLTLSFATKT